MDTVLDELRRRNVLRIGAAYLVVSWLILQFVEVVFPMLGLDEIVLGRRIFIGLLAGLPIALILAWVFEITPEGIKRERDVDRSTPAAASSTRRFDRAIIAVLLIAVLLLLVDKLVLTDSANNEAVAQTTARSIAVLPFANLSSEEDTGYFADGLTESLLHSLAQVPELRVPARTSVFAFKDSTADIREIAESLGVETVLEGSVRRSGDQLRITAQLIQADSGFHLWSKSFDRSLDDIFAVQDEIAGSVAQSLQVTLLGSKPDSVLVSTDDARAYERYLKGLEQKNIASYGSLPRAEGLFKEALAIDPSFSEAKIDLALTYRLQAETGLITSAEADTRARPLLEQVLSIDAGNSRALAHTAILDYHSALRSLGPLAEQTIAAEKALAEVVEVAPNQPALFASLSLSASVEGRFDNALTWLEQGLKVDPLSARLLLQKARLLITALDRPAEAEAVLLKAKESAPQWTAINLALGDAALARDDVVDGVRHYVEGIAMDPQDHEFPAMVGRFLYAVELDAEAGNMLERARAIAPEAAFTRSIQLEKHLRAGDHERVASLSESILADNIEDRGGAFSLAAFAYVSSMIALGQSDVVPGFFEQLRPGISAPEYAASGQKEFAMRFSLIHALNDLGMFDLSRQILDDLLDYADRVSPGWRNSDYLLANVDIARGDLDAAAEHALADLSRPLGRNMKWRQNYEYFAWTRPLLTRPAISERVAELDSRTGLVAQNIRKVLRDNQLL